MRAEVQRERLFEELRSAVEARDTLLSMAAHELNTPLTTLQLEIQLLQRSAQRDLVAAQPVDVLQARIDVIARQVTRLRALIGNLLHVARMTSGRMTLSRESVDLGNIVCEVIAQLRHMIQQSQSDVAVVVHTAVGVWDRLCLESVVANLISNALKFGEGKPISVTVSCCDGRTAQLSVTDHGIGISPEQQALIFEKFGRAVSERHYGGVGLGLWIVRQIVEAHGGTIHVASQKEKGTVFQVELPLNLHSDM